MSTIRVATIGAGAIARDHVKGCQSHKKAEVVAIADPVIERAREVAKEFGISRVYSRAEDIFQDGDVDAVTIATPNKFHAPYAIAALKAGKHVCLEKPFTLHADEARQVIAAAKRSGKVFTLAMNQRYTADAQIIRALVARGDVGDVYHAKASVRRRTGTPKFGTWFGNKALAGGGALLDIGVHFLDMCLYLIDNFHPTAVSGAVYTKFGNRKLGEGGWGHSKAGKHIFDVDDFGTAFIKLNDGVTVTLDASWVLHQETPHRGGVEIFGTEGGAALSPAKLFRFGKEKGEYEVVVPQGVALRYPHMNRFHNWIDAIAGDDELEVKPEQALAVQRILDAIYQSSETGREVRIR